MISRDPSSRFLLRVTTLLWRVLVCHSSVHHDLYVFSHLPHANSLQGFSVLPWALCRLCFVSSLWSLISISSAGVSCSVSLILFLVLEFKFCVCNESELRSALFIEPGFNAFLVVVSSWVTAPWVLFTFSSFWSTFSILTHLWRVRHACFCKPSFICCKHKAVAHCHPYLCYRHYCLPFLETLTSHASLFLFLSARVWVRYHSRCFLHSYGVTSTCGRILYSISYMLLSQAVLPIVVRFVPLYSSPECTYVCWARFCFYTPVCSGDIRMLVVFALFLSSLLTSCISVCCVTSVRFSECFRVICFVNQPYVAYRFRPHWHLWTVFDDCSSSPFLPLLLLSPSYWSFRSVLWHVLLH